MQVNAQKPMAVSISEKCSGIIRQRKARSELLRFIDSAKSPSAKIDGSAIGEF